MASSEKSELRCPTCDAVVVEVTPRPRHYPFCSLRCQLADLGKWLDEEYRFSEPAAPSLDRSED